MIRSVAERAGPEDGAELRPEHVRPVQAQPDGAQAERRVLLRGELDGRGQLVPAEVQGPDDGGAGMHLRGDRAVDGKVLFLVGQVGPVQVEELRAVQSDALRAVVPDRRQLLGELDVGGDPHPVPVLRLGRQGPQLVQRQPRVLELLLARVVAGQGLHIRGKDDHPFRAVQDHRLVVLHLRADLLHAHHGGDLQRPSHDGAVGGAPARLRRHSQHRVPVKLGGVRRAQVAGEDNGLSPHPLHVEAPALSQEIAHQPVAHVVHVRPPLPEVAVLDAGQGLPDGIQHLLHGELRVHPLVLDDGGGLFRQPAILQDQEVGVEDPRVLRSDLFGDAFLDLLDLAPGDLQRLPQARDLQRDPARIHRLPLDSRTARLDDQGFPHGDPRRNTDASEDTWAHRWYRSRTAGQWLWDFNSNSTASRTAPWPPGRRVT